MLDRVGVRSRVVTVSVAIVAVVIATLSVVLWRAVSSAMTAAAYESAVGTAASISRDLQRREPPTQVVPPDVQAYSRRAQQVLDADGKILAGSSEATRREPLATFTDAPPIGDYVTREVEALPGTTGPASLVAATRVKVDEGTTLTVVVAEPMRLDTGARQRLGAVGVLTIGGAMLILFLILRFAVRSALDPVERMRADLEAITSSRETRTVPAPRRDDEIGRLGRAINALLLRLRRSDHERAAFVSDAGHELRSPLTTIGLSVEQLSGELSPERRAVVGARAQGEVARLKALVDDLLALAKSDESAELVGAQELDLDDIVLGEVSLARMKGGEVSASLAPVRIVGVEDQVRRVVRNLVDNALRHTKRAVRIEALAEPDAAVVTVDNDGAPVPPADRERIFDRFVRLDEARDRDRGGSGLGLAIVRELVARHGGHCRGDRGPGRMVPLRRPAPARARGRAPGARAESRRRAARAVTSGSGGSVSHSQ